MTVDEPLAFEDFTQCLQVEIAPRSQAAFRAMIRPCLEILPRRLEAVSVKRLHAHARLREARARAFRAVGLLHVFTQRELDARRRASELQLLGRRAIAQLE